MSDHEKKIPLVGKSGQQLTLLDPSTIRGFANDAEAAYAAGFFDGDGHCNVRKNKHGDKIYLALHVTIGQTSLPVLEWYKERFGGNFYEYAQGTKLKGSPFWQWSITGTRAWVFLNALLPYLIVRKEQAINAMTIWEQRHG